VHSFSFNCSRMLLHSVNKLSIIMTSWDSAQQHEYFTINISNKY
jgi:hypothetical protein